MQMNQVTLPVHDMAAAVAFYRKLGFLQIVDTPHYARFACPDDGPTFSLQLTKEKFCNGAVMYFEHAEIDVWVSELTARGIRFLELPRDMPWLWREAELADPAGNKIKLYQAGRNRLYPPWRVELRDESDGQRQAE